MNPIRDLSDGSIARVLDASVLLEEKPVVGSDRIRLRNCTDGVIALIRRSRVVSSTQAI